MPYFYWYKSLSENRRRKKAPLTKMYFRTQIKNKVPLKGFEAVSVSASATNHATDGHVSFALFLVFFFYMDRNLVRIMEIEKKN